MQKVIITTFVFAIVVTVLVLLNTPRSEANSPRPNTSKQVFKVFMVSLVVCGIVAYVLQDNEENNMMANIIKGDPDF